MNSSDSPLTRVFEPTADTLFARAANETTVVSEFRVRAEASIEGIMLLAIFSQRSFHRVHENRIIAYHINHLYRLYQDLIRLSNPKSTSSYSFEIFSARFGGAPKETTRTTLSQSTTFHLVSLQDPKKRLVFLESFLLATGSISLSTS